MQEQGLDALIEGIKSIPSIPVVIERIMTLANSEDACAATLALAIENDAGLSARVLRTANSAFFLGTRSQINSLSQAVIVLGFSQIKHLAMSIGLQRQIGNLSVWDIINSNLYWRHSLAVASAAKMLAKLTCQSAENAFTAGLLHELGKCVLACCMPEQYQQALRDTTLGVEQAEKHYCGINHVIAGEQLGRYWNLPDFLISSMQVPTETYNIDNLASLVYLADTLAIEAGFPSVGENINDINVQRIDQFYAESNISAEQTGEIVGALPQIVTTIEKAFV
ncbi:MAG: HDOD domain-containing protein [Gammaproteobacteria bacterium]|nr:HDOD domain-containing protein [Gammaproteobacteria bacterium]